MNKDMEYKKRENFFVNNHLKMWLLFSISPAIFPEAYLQYRSTVLGPVANQAPPPPPPRPQELRSLAERVGS